ncbi:uncharacterized protein LOC131953804 [Physella acuta]|uniref:uncharacterized protein LOC131953804 n=1 Tax=Physella acuta TaxID=109671 RepID=UPI0027DE4AF8|nr:uncharacterized protein LOC131953804 [Physella acuta]
MILLIVLSLCCVLSTPVLSTVVRLTASPTVVDLGLTSLTVRCDVSDSSQNILSAVVAVIVSRSANDSRNYTELASLNLFIGHQVHVLTSEAVTANGSIHSYGHSFLELHWVKPTLAQAGHYICTAQGPDEVGHNINMIADAYVSTRQPGSDQLLERIRELDLDLKLANDKLAQFNMSLAHVARDVTNLSTGIEANRQEILNIAAVNNRPTWLFSRNYVVGNYSYSVSKYYYSNVATAETLCNIYGGYLAEIDDADEYNVVKNFLNNPREVNYVYTGAYGESQEGVYKFKHSDSPVYFYRWALGQPKNGTEYNCVYLESNVDWEMTVYRCHLYPLAKEEVHALCEFPSRFR